MLRQDEHCLAQARAALKYLLLALSGYMDNVLAEFKVIKTFNNAFYLTFFLCVHHQSSFMASNSFLQSLISFFITSTSTLCCLDMKACV